MVRVDKTDSFTSHSLLHWLCVWSCRRRFLQIGNKFLRKPYSTRPHNKMWGICLYNALQKVAGHQTVLRIWKWHRFLCYRSVWGDGLAWHPDVSLVSDGWLCSMYLAPVSPSLSFRSVWALFCPCEPVTVKASGGTFNKPMLLCMLEDVTHAKAGKAESAVLHAADPSSPICLCAIGCQNISWAIGSLDMTATASVQSSTDSEIKVLCKCKHQWS